MGRSSIISTTTSPFTRRVESNRYCYGPRRVVVFCLLAVITPAVFIAVPILMRFVVYGSCTYHISPSDMRLVDDKISTIWCKKQTLKANISFTAYDSNGIPQLSLAPQNMSFQKTLIIPDDYKEYWGFYLLQGSQYKISACARHKGGTLLIVKGRQHLNYCAYIGNTDSAQDSDEFSDSHSDERNPSDPNFIKSRSQSKFNRVKVDPTIPSSQEEMSILLSKIRSYIKQKPHRHDKLRKKLLDWNLAMSSSESKERRRPSQPPAEKNITPIKTEFPTTTEIMSSTSPTTTTQEPDCENCTNRANNNSRNEQLPHHHYKIRHEKSRNLIDIDTAENGKIIRRKRHDILIQKNSESGENGAYEDLQNELEAGKSSRKESNNNIKHNVPDSIWKVEHSLHSGAFNTSDPNDGSNSESESSYSSSEEALAKCEGIIASFYLQPMHECGKTGNNENTTNNNIIPILFNSTVDVSGYYYFILGSENEKTDNFMQIKFELEKYVYELPEPMVNCTNVNNCELDLQFGSNQKMVISVPQPSPNRDEIWDEYYIMESECEPRAGLYLIFVLCLPVIILMCAFQ